MCRGGSAVESAVGGGKGTTIYLALAGTWTPPVTGKAAPPSPTGGFGAVRHAVKEVQRIQHKYTGLFRLDRQELSGFHTK